ncbi:ATPase [Alteraurantiacibacter buctensis]|uniref:ATPase n=1 Tax=Alteraurantiacibacter buctensis TaxID=1503981 RepID=A0A844YVA2_9SPHN|nr:ATPase [Alteraurantiacibacter buctensis]MXO72275.1 ATPase [Alteraurantiacibacter buctensis]
MNRSKTLTALGGTDPGTSAPDNADLGLDTPATGTDHSPVFEEEWEEPAPPPSRLWPSLAVLAVLGWTGFFAWSHLADFSVGVTPAEGSALVSAWAVPVVLVVGLWLLAMRHSTREAARFGAMAQMLAGESQVLERRLASVNAELSLARDFIAAQSRDLESLGRLAAERISANAAQLQDLIRDNGAQVNAIGEVSDTALANMDKLRDRLPVVANSARDLTSQIGHAGNVAQDRLEEMIAAFERLNAFGEASGRQVDTLRENTTATLAAFEERLGALQAAQSAAHQRFATATQEMKDRVAQAIADIQQIDESAITNSRLRVEALGEAERKVREAVAESDALFAEAQAERAAAMEAAQREALSALEQRLAEFDQAAILRQQEHATHVAAMAEKGEELAARLAEIDAELARLAQAGSAESAQLAEACAAFTRNLEEGRSTLERTTAQVTGLTDSSVRLLELIRAAGEHSEGTLARGIGQADARLSSFGERLTQLSATLGQVESRGSSLLVEITASKSESVELLATLATLEDRLGGLKARAEVVASTSAADLQAAIAALDEAATTTLARLQGGQADAVRAIAEELGETASTILSETLAASGSSAIADLRRATEEATEQGRSTAVALRDQLAKVNQLAGNLEQRVAQARAQAEEQVNNDFTRRMALITESLNSCSIDIARALDAEVADTAWASYLKGDRGIFTRRAVRLLDNQEVRAIAEAYDADEELRLAVNRYIHDFEALLRPILSTRDGNAMGVTLISSDIGKLYVVLAQAIERLRD